MSKPENPQAFPLVEAAHNGFINEGMTLLDWFAGRAMVAYIKIAYEQGEVDDALDNIAWWSYNDAEAMLAERQKRMKQ